MKKVNLETIAQIVKVIAAVGIVVICTIVIVYKIIKGF